MLGSSGSPTARAYFAGARLGPAQARARRSAPARPGKASPAERSGALVYAIICGTFIDAGLLGCARTSSRRHCSPSLSIVGDLFESAAKRQAGGRRTAARCCRATAASSTASTARPRRCRRPRCCWPWPMSARREPRASSARPVRSGRARSTWSRAIPDRYRVFALTAHRVGRRAARAVPRAQAALRGAFRHRRRSGSAATEFAEAGDASMLLFGAQALERGRRRSATATCVMAAIVGAAGLAVDACGGARRQARAARQQGSAGDERPAA